MASVTCLLLLLAAAGVLGGPAPQRSGVAVFDTEVTEGQAKFVQHLELDFEKQTEKFSVPAHNTLDAADKMHDLVKGYSVTCYRERVPPLCVLADLSRVPHAAIMELNVGFIINQFLDRKGKIDSANEDKVIKTRWVMTDGPLPFLAFLSSEMQQFIGDLPVFRVEPLPDDAIVFDTPIPDTKEQTGDRVRRDTIVTGKAPTCKDSNGKKINTNTIYGYIRSDCAYIYECNPKASPTDPKRCKKVDHLYSAVYVTCECCPGVTDSNKCLCYNAKTNQIVTNGSG